MIVERTEEFRRDTSKVRDRLVQRRVEKMVHRILINPEVGKPLSHELKGLRSLRVPPFRLVYEVRGERVILHKFQHRKEVYR